MSLSAAPATMAYGEHSDRSRAVTPPKSSDFGSHLASDGLNRRKQRELSRRIHSVFSVTTCSNHCPIQRVIFHLSDCLLVMNPGKLGVSTLVTALIVLTGCWNSSKPPTYPVTGTVTSQGKPVAGAVITFVPTGTDGDAASAITDSEGKYALTTWEAGDGARPGQYGVKVSKQEQAAVDPSKMVQNLTIEEE